MPLDTDALPPFVSVYDRRARVVTSDGESLAVEFVSDADLAEMARFPGAPAVIGGRCWVPLSEPSLRVVSLPPGTRVQPDQDPGV